MLGLISLLRKSGFYSTGNEKLLESLKQGRKMIHLKSSLAAMRRMDDREAGPIRKLMHQSCRSTKVGCVCQMQSSPVFRLLIKFKDITGNCYKRK